MSNQNPGCLFGIFEIFKPKSKQNVFTSENPKIKEEPLFNPTYKRKFLLTKNELYFYKELKKVAEQLNLSVLAKVRMADLVEPKSSGKAYYSEFAKIKAKHVDFALCNPDNLYIVLLIELDDNSHNSSNTTERDAFVETVYQSTGYKLYRARGTANLEKEITQILNSDLC